MSLFSSAPNPVNVLSLLLPLLTQNNIASGAIPISALLPIVAQQNGGSAQSIPVTELISSFMPLVQQPNGQVPSAQIMQVLLSLLAQAK